VPRYVAVVEAESLYDGLAGVLRPESHPRARDSEIEERFGGMGAVHTSFGRRWLRRYGALDEMHRTLSVIEVERLDRHRILGI
jgi:hypothetical protein